MNISNSIDKTLDIKVNNETNLSNNNLTVINDSQKDIAMRKRTKMYDPNILRTDNILIMIHIHYQ